MSIAATIFIIHIWGVLFLLLVKALAFVAYKAKVLVIKKIALIVLGIISSTLTALTVFLPIIIWGIIIYLLWHFFVDFYKGIFEWLQEKLCQLRDWFDERYDAVAPYGQPINLGAVLALMAVEAILVAGVTVCTIWLQLSILDGVQEMSGAQSIFATILCAAIGLQMYISYRADTDILHRLKGDGLDYGLLTIFGTFEDITDS